MGYKAEITEIGEMALDFLADKMIIIFNDNAPAELAEISVLHTIEEVEQDIHVGDRIRISDEEYIVTAVGEEANKTFRQLGHCTLKFSGKSEAELPGHVELKGSGIPDIKIGDAIEIEYGI